MILFVLKLSVLAQLSWYEKRAGHGHVRRSARILIKASTTPARERKAERERRERELKAALSVAVVVLPKHDEDQQKQGKG